ncbi:uncharacterized protein [Dysidea avara]|uniref:uncharacterized protein isoform X2 n=1 Tax=Dysidea avara TaxID=196820 RepID=UPI003333FF9A
MTMSNTVVPTIAVLGSYCAGKTSIVHRYHYDEFKLFPAACGFVPHVIEKDERKLMVLDTEDYMFHCLKNFDEDPLFSMFIKNVQGIMLVLDITNSFHNDPILPEGIIKVVERLNLVMLLVGNKLDQESERQISYEECQKVAEEHGFTYVEVSAKTGYNINKAFQMLSALISKDPWRLVSKRPHRVLLNRNIGDAIREHKTIQIRFLKILLTGSGAAGKTSFCHLLLNQKFRKDHHSTNLVHTSHAITVTKAVIQSSCTPSATEWVQLGFNTEIDYLQSLFSMSSAPREMATREMSIIPTSSHRKPWEFLKQLFSSNTSNVERKIPSKHLSTFDRMVQSCVRSQFDSSSSLLHYCPEDVLNIITILDTGGQPEYIHLLPVLNLSPVINFIIHDLSKDLTDQVMVKHSQDGKPTFTPYPLSYSNLDMIKLLMSTVNDSVERDSSCILKTAKPGTDSNCYLCLVGTHADKVTPDVITVKADKLTGVVDNMKCRASVWQREDGSVLFPVDNTTAGTNHEDPNAMLIRNRIEELASKRNTYELPVTWMLLNLEIQQVCSKKSMFYISFDECLTIARTSGLVFNPREVKNVLRYYHLLGVLLYYEEVPGLCDYIITDHQWLFEKLSQVVCLAFQGTYNDHSAAQRFNYQGLLSKDVFQNVKWESDIKWESFLCLLVQMKAVATVTTKGQTEYFIPFVLPNYSDQQKSELLFQYGHLKGDPFLIRFKSGLLPRGLFCSLIVQLLQPPTEWHPHFSQGDTHHTFRNLITFALPNAYSLSLFDKVSCLEIQIRHKERDFNSPGHYKILKRVERSLTLACKHLKFNHTRLEHGFWCTCHDSLDGHIAILPTFYFIPPQFATCSLNSTKHVRLNQSHLLWLTNKVFPTENGQLCKPETNVQKDLPDATQGITCDNSTTVSSPQSTTNIKLLREIVVQKVAAYWDEVSDYLEYEPEYQHLIRKKCHNDPEECCLELLKDWFSSSRGVSPKSWPKLVSVLREIKGHASTAEKIAKDLAKAGVAGVKPCENATI